MRRFWIVALLVVLPGCKSWEVAVSFNVESQVDPLTKVKGELGFKRPLARK